MSSACLLFWMVLGHAAISRNHESRYGFDIAKFWKQHPSSPGVIFMLSTKPLGTAALIIRVSVITAPGHRNTWWCFFPFPTSRLPRTLCPIENVYKRVDDRIRYEISWSLLRLQCVTIHETWIPVIIVLWGLMWMRQSRWKSECDWRWLI